LPFLPSSVFAALLALPIAAAPPPPTMLWAWEVPEDLRFLPASEAGVAFLATSLLLRDDSVLVRRRMQPLRVNPATPVMAVVRIESDARRSPVLSARQRAEAVDLIQGVVRTTRVFALQIDYDARSRERGFYKLLLQQLRARLGSGIFLSMTALVSWCGSGSWLRGLPVDEIVPMLFRMGPVGPATRYRLNHGGDFPAPECRAAVGVSLDEDRPPPRAGRRLYVFNPKPWSPSSVRRVLEENQKK
jgi:hypothetical protein